MTNVLVYSDLQATDGSERLFSDPSKPLQLWRVQKFYDDLYQLYKKHDCQGLWDLGDTFDDRSSIPVPALDTVLSGLSQFPHSKLGIKLIGNHEHYNRQGTVNCGRVFGSPFNGAVVTDCRNYQVSKKVMLICCAYPADEHQAAQLLESNLDYCHSNGWQTVILGHFQAVGASMNSGQSLTGIPKEVLTRANLALLGHVHKPQSLAPNVHYVGSPFQQNFGEAGEEKRVGLLDLDTLNLTWLPMPGFPTYQTSSFATWQANYHPDSEDRHTVVIQPGESAQFFAHPNRSRVCELVYQATESTAITQPTVVAEQRDWLAHYLSLVLPTGLTLSQEELLEYGRELAQAGAE